MKISNQNKKEQDGWEKQFIQEFGIHFSKSELQFVLSFIGEEIQKSHQDGYAEGLSLRKEYNDPKLIDKICSIDRVEKIKEIEGLKWDFDCDCNMCWSNKKAISQVLSILKEKE